LEHLQGQVYAAGRVICMAAYALACKGAGWYEVSSCCCCYCCCAAGSYHTCLCLRATSITNKHSILERQAGAVAGVTECLRHAWLPQQQCCCCCWSCRTPPLVLLYIAVVNNSLKVSCVCISKALRILRESLHNRTRSRHSNSDQRTQPMWTVRCASTTEG
jgi:hypothetical protein